MDDFSELYDIRDSVDDDRNFILSTALRGLYYGDSWFSLIPKDIFMGYYEPILKAMILKCNVKVACLPDDPSVIIGYSILSPDYQAIVWVYVKQAWRKKGIAKSLVPKHPIAVMHLTRLGKTLLTKFPTTIFNPFFQLN